MRKKVIIFAIALVLVLFLLNTWRKTIYNRMFSKYGTVSITYMEGNSSKSITSSSLEEITSITRRDGFIYVKFSDGYRKYINQAYVISITLL